MKIAADDRAIIFGADAESPGHAAIDIVVAGEHDHPRGGLESLLHHLQEGVSLDACDKECSKKVKSTIFVNKTHSFLALQST